MEYVIPQHALKEQLAQSPVGQRLLDGIPEQPMTLLSSGGPGKGILSQVTGVVSGTLGGLVHVLIVLITGIYLASNPDTGRASCACLRLLTVTAC